MPTNEPFPLELFSKRVREAILAEFKGRHPTALQVDQVPDARWLGCPRIGPTILTRMRSVTRGLRQRPWSSPLATLTDIELMGRVGLLQNELERIRGELRESTAELWVRGIVPPEATTRQPKEPAGEAVHQQVGRSSSGILLQDLHQPY